VASFVIPRSEATRNLGVRRPREEPGSLTSSGMTTCGHSLSKSNLKKDNIMVEEFEKEYASLKDKVRELREYL
jgi:hypothetical protein